jgi:hypothetical protein
MMSMLKRSLFLSPLVVGCYSYAPIDPAAAPVGTEVRAHISGAASDRIAPIIQQFNQRVLTGKIDENNAGSMTLEVQTGAALNTGNSIAPLVQRVPLDRGEVVQLETRRLSTSRTAILMGAVAAGTGLAAWAALHGRGDSSGDNGGTTNPPPINRIPIIRFHF